MDLEQFCRKLSEEQKLNLAIRFIKIALPVWSKFVEKNKLTYRDSIVWIEHKVNKNILQDVIAEIEKNFTNTVLLKNLKNNKTLQEYYKDFSDPIIAIQDEDWKSPYAIEKIFYSVYNLLTALISESETESKYYIAINQAIDAIDSEKTIPALEIKSILKNIH